jgi:nucleoside-diphosphate-sugar epimerase
LKILITGSNGFLGKYIYNHLRIDNILYTLNRTNSFYNIDLSIDNFDIDENFDCVIHCSGLAHVLNKQHNNFDVFYNANVISTRNLLKKISNIKYFVYISSVSVYGLSNGVNIDESYPKNATDDYGKSKSMAEDIIINWCLENSVKYTILRLPLIVGENPPGNLGKMINAIKKGYYFNVDGGKSKKSMVLASDVANILLKAASIGGIYNLTDGYHPSFKELSLLFSNKFNKSHIMNLPLYFAKILAKIGNIIGPAFPLNSNSLNKITSTLIFDDKKARNFLNWNPKRVIDNV